MNIIIINEEEHRKLDYQVNWAYLITWEDYLKILDEREAYDTNAKGYETNKLSTN